MLTPESPTDLKPTGPADQDPAANGSLLFDLYVAFKSKPMAVVYGPSGSGKLAAAREMGRWLAGSEPDHLQEIVGHPWWANGVERAAMFTAAQEHFNREKLQALMVEAARDHAAGAFYVVVLARISPAEWGDLAALAIQFERGYLRRDLDDRPRRRLRVSQRVRVLATADRLPPAPWDPLVLRTTSLIPWSRPGRPPGDPNLWRIAGHRTDFESGVRTPRQALRKLRRLPGWRDEVLRPLLGHADLLRLYAARDIDRAAGEALVYLANAWTVDGKSLLASEFEANLRSAIGLAVRLAVVSRLAGRRGSVRDSKPAGSPSRRPFEPSDRGASAMST